MELNLLLFNIQPNHFLSKIAEHYFGIYTKNYDVGTIFSFSKKYFHLLGSNKSQITSLPHGQLAKKSKSKGIEKYCRIRCIHWDFLRSDAFVLLNIINIVACLPFLEYIQMIIGFNEDETVFSSPTCTGNA